MRRFLLIIAFAFVGAALSGAAILDERWSSIERDGAAPATIKFDAVEIWIDSKDQPLAAYQLEFKAVAGDVKIVGIEGGEHSEFASPPYYDPRAMQQERVIIASFSTARVEALPSGRTRLATIHVQTSGDKEPEYEVKPAVLATIDGKPIEARIELK
ncbi:MAG: hypothetical protein L0Y44_14875 [Phycisphaerales bacterium]|nr:hypothetical protein [Phycisphaerales bacterium]MCI0631925.1 hypothetical protein [Phycisphaerales bacterium]MCI0676203.1 hypothetical protein [Phycisphaerales bacterium]